MRNPSYAALLLSSLVGCQSSEAPLPVLSGEDFFDSPWPSDLRLDDAGHPDMSGFPNRDDIDLLSEYTELAESLYGYGNNSPVYFRFKQPLDLALLPDPEQSMDPDSPLLLLDMDVQSPQYGELIPVQWDFQEEETEYQAANLLAVAPVYGFPLRPSTTYAALVREPLARVGEEFQAVWDRDDPNHEAYRPLQQALFVAGVDVESVAVATIFTTQDPVGEMAEFADYIHSVLALPSFSQGLKLLDEFSTYDLYEGWVYAPNFEEGEAPYASSGGGLAHTESGGPALVSWEYIRFSVAIPTIVDEPDGGWPLYIYSHGTGGDYITYGDSGMPMEPANILAIRGIAGLGIDQPLHGVRAAGSADPELYTFNYSNPDSARSILRQGALDQVFLAAALTRDPPVFTSDKHGTTRIDGDNIVFLGHSQGGLAGAMAGPFLGDDVRAMVLSGAGGGIGLTIVDRKEGLDIAALLGQVLGCDADEEIDVFHPAVALLQWLTDVTDPLNYAPYWFARQPSWSTSPLHVLMTEGVLDVHTPYRTTEALAAAAWIPVLSPDATDPLAYTLLDLEPVDRPATGDATGWDGSPITAGLAQYPEQDHFAIFQDSDAASLYAGFLETAVSQEEPEIPQ